MEFYSNEELITQEIALYKISAEILRQSDTVDRIIRQWNARFIEINPAYVVVEKTGTREEIDRMRETLAEEKLLDEFTRSGSVVLHRRIGGRETAGENIGSANPARVHTDSIRYLRLLANGCRYVSGKQTGERDHLKSGQTKK